MSAPAVVGRVLRALDEAHLLKVADDDGDCPVAAENGFLDLADREVSLAQQRFEHRELGEGESVGRADGGGLAVEVLHEPVERDYQVRVFSHAPAASFLVLRL